MNRIYEAFTTTLFNAPTATTGISSTTLVDMSVHEKVVVKVVGHRLPDDKGAGVITLSIFESNSGSTWSASATAITVGVATATLNSASDINMIVELDTKLHLSTNAGKRWVGAYVKPNTSTVISTIALRGNSSYNPQR